MSRADTNLKRLQNKDSERNAKRGFTVNNVTFGKIPDFENQLSAHLPRILVRLFHKHDNQESEKNNRITGP